METAIIYFSDKSTLTVKEGDFLIPIICCERDNITSSIGKAIELWSHIHNGLIPSLMDTFAQCDFFYLNHDYNTVYNANSIVKIVLE